LDIYKKISKKIDWGTRQPKANRSQTEKKEIDAV